MMKIRKFAASLLVAMLVMGQTPVLVLAEDPTAPADASVSTEPVASTTPAVEPVAEPTPTQPTTTEPVASEPVPTPSQPAPATEPVTTPTVTTPAVTETTTGPSQPTGTIPTYAFDETTRKWVPTRQETFRWNAQTGFWESPYYRYVARTGWYYTIPEPVAPATDTNGTLTGYATPQEAAAAAILAKLLGISDPINSNTGAGSTNTAALTNNNSGLIQLLSQAAVNNDLTSTATSGDASVSQNTNGGNAITGAANVVASLLNLLNSAWGWAAGGLNYFVQNLAGDQFGDITLDTPQTSGTGGGLGAYGGLSQNNNTGAGSDNTATTTNNNDLTVVNRPTGSINNDIDLLAQSGNATVGQNTNAGDAQSGDAMATLNIINLINSWIASGQSFFGILNIDGNWDGDLLFEDGFVDNAIGSSVGGTAVGNTNTGAGSTNTADYTGNNTANIENTPQAAFNNNINLAAQSGAATVSENTNSGDALTGDASTEQSLFNLFNTSIFGENAVLVLVNVAGRWTGQFMNLLTGGDNGGAALLTGGAQVQNNNTGPNSTNTATVTDNNNVNIVNQPNGTITNNVNAGALSGNATVSQNTNAGRATSGDARVFSNVANIFNAGLNLRGWFGVLMLNITGNWNGSVGVDTAAGEVAQPVSVQAPVIQTHSQGSSRQQFSQALSGSATSTSPTSITSSADNTGDTKVAGVQQLRVNSSEAASKQRPTALLIGLAAAFMLVAGAMSSLERKFRGGV